MIRAIAFLFCLHLAALPARAEEIVLGLSQDEVAITATFDGSDILIFGAIKRDAPSPATGDLGVIVTVAGPEETTTVRRKSRRLGIWVNTDSAEIAAAPTFYAVASNRPLTDILDSDVDAAANISTTEAVMATAPGADAFTEALIRIRENANLYQTLPEGVWVDDETLFRSLIALPANLTDGIYTAEIFLTRAGEIIDTYTTEIPVKKVGLERFLYNLAHDKAPLYGLMSLLIAIFAGWGASAIFSAFRR